MKAIVEADMSAFGDVRNLLFDRELGTNVMTEFADSERVIEMAREIRKQIGPEMVERLVNVPDMHGDSVGMRVISKGSFEMIQSFLEVSGNLTKFKNDHNKVNVAHLIVGNQSLSSKEKLLLVKTIVPDKTLISKDNF